MAAYMSRGAGVLTVIRTEHRVDLRALTLTLYHSNEQLGDELSKDAVRKAIASVLADYGDELVITVSDYIREAREFDDGHAVGSTTDQRLEWARRLVVKAYRADFQQFPEELAAFEALPVTEIA